MEIRFRGLSVLDLGRGTGRTDRQTDDGHQRLMPPHYTEVGGIISNRRIGTQVVSAAEVTYKRHSRSPAMSPFDTSHEFLISTSCTTLRSAILTSFIFPLGTLFGQSR